jgi:histidyl-tRNA synthetase
MIRAITGTKDILPVDINKWGYLEQLVRKIFTNFNYKEIRTPIFEETQLFARGIGEETDIVGKEMYTFQDRSGASLTLKPEMTASVVRAFIEHSLGKLQTLNKLFYISPMFRQEKPQAGRYRQFHQFGAEVLGSSSPLADAEIIIIAYKILVSLGLNDLKVKINSIGIPSARENYKSVLREYLEDKLADLTEESKIRFEKNILRIFDSKAENDIEIMRNAPLIIDYLDDESRADFDIVKEALNAAGIPFEVDPSLVRGLDYYTKTTFEIISGKVGSQSALCGGGRYDLLINQLGGSDTPAVGFAAGIERILLACENEKALLLEDDSIDLYIAVIEKELNKEAFNISCRLREKGIITEMDYSARSVKAQMREANKLKAKYVLFIGGDEYKEGCFNMKNMATGEQNKIPIDKTDSVVEIFNK